MTIIGKHQVDEGERRVMESAETQTPLEAGTRHRVNQVTEGHIAHLARYRSSGDEFSRFELEMLSALVAIELASRYMREPTREMLLSLQSKLQRMQGFQQFGTTKQNSNEATPAKQVS